MATIFSERMFSRWESVLGDSADQLGLTREIFRRPDVEYPIEQYTRLLETASRQSEPAIGLAVGSSSDPGDLGALGHATAAAPTLGQALRLLSRYLYVLAHGNAVRLDVGQRRAVVNYYLKDEFTAIHTQDIELATSFIARMIRTLSGKGINPLLVELERAQPEYARELQSFFACEVRYGCSSNRLHYRKEMLEVPCLSSDPSLLEALEFFLADRMKVRDVDEDLVARVNHLISAALESGAPDIGHIASLLGLSRRTLQRRLAADKLVFSDMVEDVRRTIAMDYVSGDEYSLTDIAHMLGYSELSAFSRAFRRWTDQSPQEFRDAATAV